LNQTLHAIALSCLFWAPLAMADQTFTLSSEAFADGGALSPKNGGNIASNPNCSGQNISPPLAWRHAPATTRSFAIVMVDPDGRLGLGVNHWVAYGIAPTVVGFAEGEAGQPTPKYVHGVGTRGLDTYTGPCPPPGTGSHHYVITVIATDLPPDALPRGLTREDLFARLEGHALAASSIVARAGHGDP
jgi:Raf kinase inhibitor-like YbhB/YbcL family protein